MLKESLILYKRLYPFIKPYLLKIFLACACAIPLSLCAAITASLVKPTLDDVFLNKDLRMLNLIPIVIISIYITKGIFEYAYSYLISSTGQRIVTAIRNRIYEHLQTLSLSYFQTNPTGKLISKVTLDVQLVEAAINKSIIAIIRESMTITSLVFVMVTKDYKLSFITFLILPWAIIPILLFGKKSRKFSTRHQEKRSYISTLLHETISGNRIVKAFGMEEYEKKRFSEENLKLFKIILKKLKNKAISSPVMELIGGLTASAVIFYGGWNVLSGNSTPGTFFSFVSAMLLLYGPSKNINNSYQDIQDGLAAAKRVFEIFDTEPEIKEKADAVSIQCKNSSVRFKNVTFSYDKDPVLHNIELYVKPHETIAIVGMTGSSKTTLVNLIPRFYDVDSGSIQIDGIDIRDVTLKSLRSKISIVNQHPFLFNDSLKNNIAYGDNTQSLDKIIEAAHDACAHQFINEMPDKYGTVIGEHGVKLSGGQRQRIAIARAILKNAPILIFDEATSSLDTNLEKAIQSSLEKLIKNKTTFIVAHRLSTIRNADRIIVLSNGRIVEQGSHDKLFQQKGEYSKLYEIYAHKEQKQS